MTQAKQRARSSRFIALLAAAGVALGANLPLSAMAATFSHDRPEAGQEVYAGASYQGAYHGEGLRRLGNAVSINGPIPVPGTNDVEWELTAFRNAAYVSPQFCIGGKGTDCSAPLTSARWGFALTYDLKIKGDVTFTAERFNHETDNKSGGEPAEKLDEKTVTIPVSADNNNWDLNQLAGITSNNVTSPGDKSGKFIQRMRIITPDHKLHSVPATPEDGTESSVFYTFFRDDHTDGGSSSPRAGYLGNNGKAGQGSGKGLFTGNNGSAESASDDGLVPQTVFNQAFTFTTVNGYDRYTIKFRTNAPGKMTGKDRPKYSGIAAAAGSWQNGHNLYDGRFQGVGLQQVDNTAPVHIVEGFEDEDGKPYTGDIPARGGTLGYGASSYDISNINEATSAASTSFDLPAENGNAAGLTPQGDISKNTEHTFYLSDGYKKPEGGEEFPGDYYANRTGVEYMDIPEGFAAYQWVASTNGGSWKGFDGKATAPQEKNGFVLGLAYRKMVGIDTKDRVKAMDPAQLTDEEKQQARNKFCEANKGKNFDGLFGTKGAKGGTMTYGACNASGGDGSSDAFTSFRMNKAPIPSGKAYADDSGNIRLTFSNGVVNQRDDGKYEVGTLGYGVMPNDVILANAGAKSATPTDVALNKDAKTVTGKGVASNDATKNIVYLQDANGKYLKKDGTTTDKFYTDPGKGTVDPNLVSAEVGKDGNFTLNVPDKALAGKDPQFKVVQKEPYKTISDPAATKKDEKPEITITPKTVYVVDGQKVPANTEIATVNIDADTISGGANGMTVAKKADDAKTAVLSGTATAPKDAWTGAVAPKESAEVKIPITATKGEANKTADANVVILRDSDGDGKPDNANGGCDEAKKNGFTGTCDTDDDNDGIENSKDTNNKSFDNLTVSSDQNGSTIDDGTDITSNKVTANKGNVKYAATNLPAGMSLDPNTGVLSGHPTNVDFGTGKTKEFNITVTGTTQLDGKDLDRPNNGGKDSASYTYKLVVNKKPTMADTTTPVKPVKVPVTGDSLTQADKDKIKKSVCDANTKNENVKKACDGNGSTEKPGKVEVGNDGKVTITYPDGSTDEIPATDTKFKVTGGSIAVDENKEIAATPVITVDPANTSFESTAGTLPEGLTGVTISKDGKISGTPKVSNWTREEKEKTFEIPVTVVEKAGGPSTVVNVSVTVKKAETPKPAKTLAEQNDPTKTKNPVVVTDPHNLTDAEKAKVREEFCKDNQDKPAVVAACKKDKQTGEGNQDKTADVVVDIDGSIKVTYTDGSTDTVAANVIPLKAEPAEFSVANGAGLKESAVVKDGATSGNSYKLKGAAPAGLTGLSVSEDGKISFTKAEVTDWGNANTKVIEVPITVTNGAATKDITVKVTVTKTQTDAEKNEPTKPEAKTPVLDTNKLTDDEKKAVKKAVCEAAGQPESVKKACANTTDPTGDGKAKNETDGKVTVDDKGNVTITYPDGSKDTIDGKDLVSQKKLGAPTLQVNPAAPALSTTLQVSNIDPAATVVEVTINNQKVTYTKGATTGTWTTDNKDYPVATDGNSATGFTIDLPTKDATKYQELDGKTASAVAKYKNEATDPAASAKSADAKLTTKSTADKTDVVNPDKTLVDDPTKLTDDEKKAVKKAVCEAPGQPEAVKKACDNTTDPKDNGTTKNDKDGKVTVDDKGNVTITYPDGSKDTIPAADTVEPKFSADKSTITVDSSSVEVNKPVKITFTPKDKNGKTIVPSGPAEISVTVPGVESPVKLTKQSDGTYTGTATPAKAADGEVKVTTVADGPLKGAENTPGAKLTVTDGTAVTPGAGGQITDKVTPKDPSAPVAVLDKTGLTPAEKNEVVKAVCAANKDVPEVVAACDNTKQDDSNGPAAKDPNNKAKIEVGNDGNVTITYADGSTDTIPAEKTVEQKKLAAPKLALDPETGITKNVKVTDVDKDAKFVKVKIGDDTVTFTKDKDGNWTSDNEKFTATKTDAGFDIAIPADDTLNGKQVTAVAHYKSEANDPAKSVDSNNVTLNTKADTPAPVVKVALKEPAAAEKTKVANPTALSPTEKDKVKAAVAKANPGIDESKIDVADNGDVIVKGDSKYQDGNITRDKVITADLKPGSKVTVADKNKLTDEEKGKVQDAVVAANPGLAKDNVVVGTDGSVTLKPTEPIYSGSLTPDQSVTDKPQITDSVTAKNPTNKVKVNNKGELTSAEKDAVKKAVCEANKDNAEIVKACEGKDGAKVEVGNDGSVTITYTDGSTDVIPAENTVEQNVLGKPSLAVDPASGLSKTVKVSGIDPAAKFVKVDFGGTVVTYTKGANGAWTSDNTDFPVVTGGAVAGEFAITLPTDAKKYQELNGKQVTAVAHYQNSASDPAASAKSNVVTLTTKATNPPAAGGKDVVAPDTKTPVVDPNHLTDKEKDAVKDNIVKKNPGLDKSKITVDDKGNAEVKGDATYADKKIPAKDLVEKANSAPGSGTTTPTPTPGNGGSTSDPDKGNGNGNGNGNGDGVNKDIAPSEGEDYSSKPNPAAGGQNGNGSYQQHNAIEWMPNTGATAGVVSLIGLLLAAAGGVIVTLKRRKHQ